MKGCLLGRQNSPGGYRGRQICVSDGVVLFIVLFFCFLYYKLLVVFISKNNLSFSGNQKSMLTEIETQYLKSLYANVRFII